MLTLTQVLVDLEHQGFVFVCFVCFVNQGVTLKYWNSQHHE